MLISRASIRLVAHKFITLLVAPVLLLKVVGHYSKQKWSSNVWDRVKTFEPAGYEHIVKDINVWRMVVTVIFVATLGNIVLSIVDTFLDVMNLGNDDEKKCEPVKGK